MAPCPDLLPADPALALPLYVVLDTSKSYSRHASATCSDLAPSAPSDCPIRGPTLLSSAYVTAVPDGSVVCSPPIRLPLLLLAPCVLVDRAVGGFLSPPPCPCPYSLGLSSVAVVPPGVSSPRGSSATQGVSMPCVNSTPPPPPWRPPPQGFRHSGGLAPSSLSPTLGDSWATTEALLTPVVAPHS